MINNRKNEIHTYLLNEYEQMFAEKRHTDGRFTFMISLYYFIITICVSILAIGYKTDSIIENASNKMINGMKRILQ